MEYVFVGFGGIFGGITRYLLGKYISSHSKAKLPIGTFIINITGALLLGILTSASTSKEIYLILGEGFLGAYTTFSTFMYEGFNLFNGKRKLNAVIYVLSSVILGVLGFYAGSKIIIN
ncbi:fluoride efflux transporter CrcB [Clostridium oryzae]|uniref:Fluoride-specific ion channel FluC n=1 Tax=Clostridium oryzae TaxID=1450648 RepID=A0A1V4INC3_9CLOT|nr:fluoride efflux transporter CrcB [Clostridium oryzae]OPJ60987.1 putative fluoride ion transporter CrcB [Clostridium oryzae]